MADLERIPLVQRESEISQNSRMIFVVGFIVVLSMYLVYYQQCDIYIPGTRMIEPLTAVVPKNKLNPILIKYIQLITPNHKVLPINKIVIIDKDKNIIPLYLKDAIYRDDGKSGSVIEFIVPKSLYISQMIIHLDMFSKDRENIKSTQVRLRDNEYDTRWTSTHQLPVEKYIDVYVSRPHYIYPIPQQVLDPNMTTPKQEVSLTQHLIHNTWS